MTAEPTIEFDADGRFRLYTSRRMAMVPMLRSLALVPLGAGFLWLLFRMRGEAADDPWLMFALAALFCGGAMWFGWNRFHRYAALRELNGPAVHIGRDGLWDRELEKPVGWDAIQAVGFRKAQRYHSGGRSPFRPMGSLYLSPPDGSPDVELPSTSAEIQAVSLRYLLHLVRRLRPDKCAAQIGYDPWDHEAEFRPADQTASLVRRSFGAEAASFVEQRRQAVAKGWFGARRAEAWGRVAKALAKAP